jgi:putative Mn2+ efflux pump MntP
MDATAAAAARGLAAQRVRVRDVLRVALLFGGFQAAMPLCGYALGASLGPWVRAVDHWIVFALLGGLGVHMLFEAREQAHEADARADHAEQGEGAEASVFGLRILFVLAVATSLDA